MLKKEKIAKNILISLILFFLTTGCSQKNDDSTVNETTTNKDWILQEEKYFNISIPAGYEKITPEKTNIIMPDDFVLGFIEIRYDNNFANNINIQYEKIDKNIDSKTYAIALADSVHNLTDYEDLGLEEFKFGSKDSLIHSFKFNSEKNDNSIYSTQLAITNNDSGYLISCTTEKENELNLCRDILKSFYIK